MCMLHMFCFVSRVFQRVNDLPPTGELDEATLEVMRQPRCGMEDPFNKKQHRYRVMGEFRITTLSASSLLVFLPCIPFEVFHRSLNFIKSTDLILCPHVLLCEQDTKTVTAFCHKLAGSGSSISDFLDL